MHTVLHIPRHISTATFKKYSVTLWTFFVIPGHIDNRLTAVWCAPCRESLSWQPEPSELLRTSGCISVYTSRLPRRSHWYTGKHEHHHEKRASLCAPWMHRLLERWRLRGKAVWTGAWSTVPVFRGRLFPEKRSSYCIVKVQFLYYKTV